jgi:predicted nucleic acid-binding protein
VVLVDTDVMVDSLGIINALIGQLALSLDLPLYTFNQEHYAAIPRLQVVQPYSRD